MEAFSCSPAESLKTLTISSTNKTLDGSSKAAQQRSQQQKSVLPIRTGAVPKPKQIKSRNGAISFEVDKTSTNNIIGCSTCKAKRLKCDETKPSCNQCIKRKVTCGGYSKNFKWRSFEETISHSPKLAQITGIERTRGQDAATPDTPPSPLLSDRNSTSSSTDDPATPHAAGAAMTKTHSSTSVSTPTMSVYLKHGLISDGVGQNGKVHASTFARAVERDVDHDKDHDDLMHRPIKFASQSTADSFVSTSSQSFQPPRDSSGLSLSLNRPRLATSSPEMLAYNFDRNTCGILSIKDGLNENPWRTLVWPMARESPALYHAIASLSAFHCSALDPKMKYSGMKHVNQSISYLRKNIKKMKIEDTLATSITLAFADSWDNSTSTGIEHVRGGSVLISHALTRMKADQAQVNSCRLKFLCKTWLYVDVLSRLTSNRTDDVDVDCPLWSQIDLLSSNDQIDPLLGCASTLFPIIGRVANLISRVKKTRYNTISLISKANELKHELTTWNPPSYLEPAEDPTCDVQHAIQTAEAYQYATLLCLHQAVPEIPSRTAEDLAQKILLRIATVPIQSRTMIIHIYPMLAATCEAVAPDDRAWALKRWQQMQRRMQISNVDRCIEVMQEVWRRRDQASQATNNQPASKSKHASILDFDASGADIGVSNFKNTSSRRDSHSEGLQPLPFERTVRGSQHWAGVMMEYGWESEFLINNVSRPIY